MTGARESGLGAGYVSRSTCGPGGRRIGGQETTDEKEQLW